MTISILMIVFGVLLLELRKIQRDAKRLEAKVDKVTGLLSSDFRDGGIG